MKKITSVFLLPLILIFVFTSCTKNTSSSQDHNRLLKAESMLEIQSVLAAYAMAWDRENTKEFANIFHKDAVIIDSWNKVETDRYNGVQAFMDAREDEHGNVGGHTLSLVYYKELTENTASTEVIFNYFCYPGHITNTSSCNIRGSYIDEWIKTEKGWRIMKRIIEHETVPEHRAERYNISE